MTESLCVAVFSSKIPRLISLLGSDKDGEVLGAARALQRSLRADGKDFHDLARAIETRATDSQQNDAAAHRDWRADLRLAAAWFDSLPDREQDFITSLVSSTRWRAPTERQMKWLADIAEKLRRSAA